VSDGPFVRVTTNSPGDDLSLERGTFADGALDGPTAVSWSQMNPTTGALEPRELGYRAYRRGRPVGEVTWQFRLGQWQAWRLSRRDDLGRLIAAHHRQDGYALDAEMPGGTGAFLVTDAEGRPRARGACLDGKREGAWVALDPGGVEIERRTYARGRLHGSQATRDGRGEVRDGRRVGTWTLFLPEQCVIEGRQHGKCGFVGCAVAMAAATVTVRYKDDAPANARLEILAIEWDRRDSPGTRDPKLVVLADGGVSAEVADCEALAAHVGSPDLP